MCYSQYDERRPRLGSIQPSQADYYQSTRGGGKRDYRTLCYAPSSIQELVDYVMLALIKLIITGIPF